jgi:hypothetical protein
MWEQNDNYSLDDLYNAQTLPHLKIHNSYVTSGFRRYVDDICTLLGYYAALSDSSIPTFRDNL